MLCLMCIDQALTWKRTVRQLLPLCTQSINQDSCLHPVAAPGHQFADPLSLCAVNVSRDFKSAAMALGDMLAALDKLHLTVPEDVHEDLMHVQGQLWRLDFEVSAPAAERHAMSARHHTRAAFSLTFHRGPDP